MSTFFGEYMSSVKQVAFKIMASMLVLFASNNALAVEACSAVFPGVLQTHNDQGEVTLRYGSVLVGQADGIVATSKINSSVNNVHCSGSACVASGVNSTEINLSEFVKASNGDNVSVGYLESLVLGLSWNNEFKNVDVGPSAILNFSSDHESYLIKKLTIGYGATVNLTPGDYWIEQFAVGANASINIVGDGVVRIFVRKGVTISHRTAINVSGLGDDLDSQKMFLFANGDINLASEAKINGLVYSRKDVKLGYSSEINGAISAKNITLGFSTLVEFNALAVQKTEFSQICSWGVGIDDLDGDGVPDEIDLDRDGDNISNYYELLVNTNPDDVTDAPADINFNGVPDSMELSSGANQCVSAFTTGLQSHAIDSKLIFSHNAQLLNSASQYLPFSIIKNHAGSNLLSCETSNCIATGFTIVKLDAGEFKATTSNVKYTLSHNSTAELDGSITDYNKIRVKSNSTLKLRNQNIYRIKKLNIGWNSTLQLEPGEYWIEKLSIGSESKLEVIGNGTVRLFVKDKMHLGWQGRVNVNAAAPGTNADKLFVYSYGKVFLSSNSVFEGHIFSVDKVKLDYAAQLYGAIAANDIKLSANTKVNYQPTKVENIDFGFICDIDNDGTYDGFDADRDGDGINNDYEVQVGTDPDNVASVPADLDKDGIPDLIDIDRDGDGVENALDAFPDDVAESSDIDNDGIGDNADTDRDGDGISNNYETQLGFNPNDATNTPPDLDTDGIPDSLDDDRDGDGVANSTDMFPDDATESTDLDNDGIGDNADTDRDGDGISNNYEIQLGTDPNNAASVPLDLDSDGIPDALDADRDGDGVENATDVFPDNSAESSDIDNDGIGDNADTDRDGDGISNDYEVQVGTDPNNSSSTPPDLDADGIPNSLDDDRDGDGVDNTTDKFPDDATETADLDNDGIGDNADTDRDGDGISNDYETQLGFNPNDATNTPPDLDADGIPNSLDDDRDGDGVDNTTDKFPDDATESTDLDNDGIGDNADTDRDGDGISNNYETQLGFNPNDATNTPPDLDADGIPNSLDDDRDGDGVANTADKFPDDATETADLDNDGIGDNADTDRDGDGISNDYEVQVGTDPNNSSSTPPDLDADGIPDSLDDDRDGDGVNNTSDAFPNDKTESADLDGDGIGDNTDLDIDGDGVDNLVDLFPLDATESADLDNDGIGDNSDPDTDGDGVNNDVDALPNDPSETSDIDGDGIGDNADTDRDGDGISNSYEEQIGTDPNNASSVPADLDADGIPDTLDIDRDGDAVNNDQDTYPDDNSRSKLPVVTNIQASLQTNTAQLQWAALSGEPVTSYNVYRNTTVDTNWLKLNSTTITTNSYVDNNLIAGTSYRYRVIAVDTNGIEGESATPVNLFAAFNTVAVENFTLSLQNAAAQLNWLAVNGLQYQIYRGVNSAAPTAFVIATTNQYTDNTIVNLQTASYQVATLAEYTNGFTGETVQIAGPRSQVETVIPLADLTASIVNASIAADGIAELAAGKNNLAHAVGGYQNAVGEVTVTATANINNVPVSINQLSNNGQFDLELPANEVATWLITIKDNAIQNRQVSTQLRVLTDTTAPSIALDGGNSRTVNAEQIILNGIVTDSGSGIKMLIVQNDRYSGITFTASLTDDRFVIEVPLKTGVNGLILVATDNAANQSQVSISVNREIAAAPRIEIISPQSATVTQNQQLNINGIIYSSQPSTDLRVEFNSQQIFPSAGTLEGTHTFSFNNVLLQSGINILSVRVDSPLGSDVTQTQVSYQTEPGNEVDAVPIILMASPNNLLVTTENQISVLGSATSSKGVASVSVNGEQIALGGATQTSLSFNTLIDLSLQAEGEVVISIVATDAEGASTTQTLTVIKDTQSPQIILSDASLQAEPAVNTVNANPYLLSGTVSDANIASLSINNQSVNLLPGISANQFTFEAALTLPVAENQPLNLVARDQAGLQTQQSLILFADVSVGIKFIAPLENEALLIAGDSTTLEVTAQFTDWLEGYQALIIHQQDAAQTMIVNGAVAQASITIPNTEGRHSISIKVQDASGELLAEATTFVKVTNAAQIPLQVSNSDPANQQIGVEPHLPVSVYFNRPINRSLIEVNVYETFTGETYDLDALEGKSALENQEIKFKQVNRNHQAVPGGLAFYPEDTLVSFYPSREFSYGATVYVDVIYDGTVLAKQSYKVRALPTFLQGSIMNNFNEPLQQIRVSIPALNREVLSDNQGNYGFGYGDAAQNALPAGRYKMIFNPGLVNRHYGTLERWVIIEAGRVSKLPLAQLTFIDANTPFERISSGELASLHGGDLQVDFSNATVYFPDGRKQGDINVQMLELGSLSYSALPSAIPHWMYSIQPMGIAVNGTVNLEFTMPTLNGEYNYLPTEGSYVVLLGFNHQSELFEPIGAGLIENRRVLSTQAIELADLSYLGYALVVPENAAILKDYAEGNISLNALKSALSQ